MVKGSDCQKSLVCHTYNPMGNGEGDRGVIMGFTGFFWPEGRALASSMEEMQQYLNLLCLRQTQSETEDRVIYPHSSESYKQADRAMHNVRLSLDGPAF